MAKVTREFIRFSDPDVEHEDGFAVDISVDANGIFYCYPRDDVYEILNDDRELVEEFGATLVLSRKKPGVVGAQALTPLKNLLFKALAIACTPEVSEELVIVYNIESHVCFAELPDGTIVPNAGWDGAEWAHGTDRDDPYGGHHAQRPNEGGYSLTVGARAYRKITKKFGEKKKEYYELYYGHGSDGKLLGHFEKEHPAGLLNSWMCFTFSGDAWQSWQETDTKEMPYTDEAALFFHRLMLGMAHLQRQIQTMVQDEKRFIDYVNSGGNFLRGPNE